MTSGLFSVKLVHAAAIARRDVILPLHLPEGESQLARLGQIIDMAVDLEAQHGDAAQIRLDIEDHKMLHGHFPKPPK